MANDINAMRNRGSILLQRSWILEASDRNEIKYHTSLP